MKRTAYVLYVKEVLDKTKNAIPGSTDKRRSTLN